MPRKSRYEHLYNRSAICNNCGRPLTCDTSIKRGYGRDCWEKLTNQGEYKRGKTTSLITQILGGGKTVS
jgi:hypothetical protein